MLQQLRPALMSVLAFTVITGGIFPAVVWGIGQVAFRHQANGSLVQSGDTVIGSELIGQAFTRPEYLHPRPSAAGSGYDAAASGGTNLGPTSDKLINGVANDSSTEADESFSGVKQLAQAYRTENGLAPDAPLPPDAVTRSASGLDPHVSPENAALQAVRIAKARNIGADAVRKIITENTQGRTLGFMGEPVVNVLAVNRALDGVK